MRNAKSYQFFMTIECRVIIAKLRCSEKNCWKIINEFGFKIIIVKNCIELLRASINFFDRCTV